jgi:hypothetical protein
MGMDDYIDLRSFSNEVASAFPANRLYCLVDHAGMPGLHAELMRAGVPWTSLFAASREAEALKAAPLLFPLDEEARKAHSQLLPWVARHGSFTSSMIMLSSPLALDELGRRLARRMNARISENMEVLLRYFDPRVFEALIPELEADQRDAFTGVADCWWYVDRTGNPVPQRAAYDAADSFDSPIVLSAQQEFALVDASEIDQVAAQVHSTVPDLYMPMGAPQRVAFLRRQMAAANAEGIVATHELALYCGLALMYGEDFSLESPWPEVLEQVRAGIPFSDAIDTMGV